MVTGARHLLLNGKLYAGWSNGRLYGWTFDGSTLGSRVDVLQQGNYVLGPGWISFADVSGMFWLDGRLYYTRAGDPNLYFRYFTPESELVGTNPLHRERSGGSTGSTGVTCTG